MLLYKFTGFHKQSSVRIQDCWIGGASLDRGRQFGRGGGQVKWQSRLWAEIKKVGLACLK